MTTTTTTVRAVAEAIGFHAEGMRGVVVSLVLPISDRSEYSLMRQDAPRAPTSLAEPASLAYHVKGELTELYHGPAGALLAHLHGEAGQPLPLSLMRYSSPDLCESITVA